MLVLIHSSEKRTINEYAEREREREWIRLLTWKGLVLHLQMLTCPVVACA